MKSASDEDGPSGTPSQGRPKGPGLKTLAIGAIVGTHGVRGELKVRILTDFPERFLDLPKLLLIPGGQSVQVEGARFHKGMALLKLEGLNSLEAAQALRGQELHIEEAEAMPLPAGTYYLHQIEGLEVFSEDGRPLGRVVEIWQSTGGADVYVVQDPQGSRWMIPAVQDFVKAIDVAAGRMIARVSEELKE
ncbi:MAG: ribosome maturation factor RimM [Candidatus Xenobia bacterium]